MGWSCRAEVSDVLHAWSDACVRNCRSQNSFKVGSATFFFDTDREEYDNGAATGNIFEMLPSNTCRVVGTFSISPDGLVTFGKTPGNTAARQFLLDAACLINDKNRRL